MLLVRGAPQRVRERRRAVSVPRVRAARVPVVSVRSTSGSSAAEHVVQFRRAAEADAARRAAGRRRARGAWRHRAGCAVILFALLKTRAERITRDTYGT